VHSEKYALYSALYKLGTDKRERCRFLKLVFALVQDFERAQYWRDLEFDIAARREAQATSGGLHD